MSCCHCVQKSTVMSLYGYWRFTLFSTILYISVESVSICRMMSITLAVRLPLSFPYSKLGGELLFGYICFLYFPPHCMYCWIGFYIQNYAGCPRSQISSFFSIFRTRRLDYSMDMSASLIFHSTVCIVESVSIYRIMSITLTVRFPLSFPYSKLGGELLFGYICFFYFPPHCTYLLNRFLVYNIVFMSVGYE